MHSPKPTLQSNPQTPLLHFGTALATAGQTFPHALQFVADVFRFTHCEPHCVSPFSHAATHWPAVLQSGVDVGQADVQDPQVFASVRSASQPFCLLPSQDA